MHYASGQDGSTSPAACPSSHQTHLANSPQLTESGRRRHAAMHHEVLLCLVLLLGAQAVFCAQTTSVQLSGALWNITESYLSRYDGQCFNVTQPEMEKLQVYLQNNIGLLQENTTFSKALQLSVQLDSIAMAGRVADAVEVFNVMQQDVYISLHPTPTFNSASEISFTHPTLAMVDGRWNDFVGDTPQDLGIYKDPNNTHEAHVMFYRRDLFKKHGIAVPQTWSDLVLVAEQLQQLYKGILDGSPFYPLCLNTNLQCGAPFLLISIISSMTFYQQGVINSLIFDPETMEPKGNNAAVRSALGVLQDLTKYNHPDASTGCYGFSRQFSKGACAVTINAAQFFVSIFEPSPLMRGNIGSSLVPGSTHVLNSKGAMVPCTQELCPYAVQKKGGTTGVLINFVPLNVPLLYRWIPNPSSMLSSSAALATFASFLANLVSTAQNAVTAALQPLANSSQAVDWSVLAATNAALDSTPRIVDPIVTQPEPFLQAGYDLFDTTSYLYVLSQILAFDNVYNGLPVIGASYLRLALGEAALNATATDANLMDIMHTLNSKFTMVVTAFNNSAKYRALYQAGVGYVPRTSNATAGPAAATGRGGTTWNGVLIAGIVIGSLLVMVGAAAVVYAKQQSRRGRTFTGKHLPPGVSPTTTLLVTDIQDSTGMWERLPPELMEQALAVHHATLQQLLDTYRGYESATEGDSFILAFYTPADALAYAAATQLALLQANWPEALLQDEPLATISRVRAQLGNPDATCSSVVRSFQWTPTASRWLLASSNLRSGRQPCAEDGPQPSNAAKRQLLPCCARASLSEEEDQEVMQSAKRRSIDAEERDNMTITTGSEGFTSGDGRSSSARNDGEGDARGCSFGWALSQAWLDDESGEELPNRSVTSATCKARPVIWRGLRVRMGMACGLLDPHSVSINPATHRTQYGGSVLAIAKKVCDSGHGGQIVLSHTAFEQLDHTMLAAVKLHVLLMGEHMLSADEPSTCLYQAVVPGLEARLQAFPPLRSKQLVSEGVMAATVGMATVVFVNASSVQLLMGWNATITQQALAIYHTKVQRLCKKFGGYLPELVDGLALAVFARPEDGVRWALAVQSALLSAPWPQELLANELCEPVMTTIALETEEGHITEVQKLAMRGLRLKVGIACGRVLDYVNQSTARIMYRGRVMNWAARIAGLASCGQVLCTEDCWSRATSAPVSKLTGITAVNAGVHMLKGVQMPVYLYSCTYTYGYEPGTRSTCASGGNPRRSSLVIGSALRSHADAIHALHQCTEGVHLDLEGGPADAC